MHIPVQQRNARDPSRAPLRGLITRCRRKAMGPREEQSARVLRAEARAEKPHRLLLLILGPVSRGEVRPESPDRVARRDAREFANGQDAHRANPGLTLRTRSVAASAAPGVHFFWLLFFVQAKKSDPLARMRAEKRRDAPSSKIKSKDTGFRLPPE